MKGLHVVAWILLVVGGLNWGLYALTGWEVGSLFGGMEAGISKTIYVLVGLAALYELFTHKKGCRSCESSGSAM
jgi:uncharacterized membrane protein YuzA (DUF378 family)